MNLNKEYIEREILNYLDNHPNAEDTIEGITQWWLLEKNFKYNAKMVRDEIRKLVAKGLLVKVSGKGTENRYRIKKEL